MGIFDVFTAEPASNAANSARGVYNDARTGVSNISDITRRHNEDLLRSGYGTARTDLGMGYDTATGAINTGATNALGYLDTGTNAAIGRLDSAKSAYDPVSALAGQFGSGATMYANALGLNGAAGTTAAQNAFTATPSYNWTRDQGIDAINRRRNAAGSLVGGNADRDAIDYVTGLASKEYNTYLDRLKDYNNLTLGATTSAASGRAGADTAAANVYNQSGVNKSNVASNQGNTLADLARSYYSSIASGDTSLANALTNNMNTTSGWQVNTVNNLAQPTAKTYTDEAQASLTGSKNLWNLGTNLASLAAGAGGGSSGGNTFLPSSSFMNNSWGW